MWLYRSPIGPIYIKQLADGKYGLFYNGQCSGKYRSPVAAADDVYTHTSGINEWDLRPDDAINDPTDLSQWEHF